MSNKRIQQIAKLIREEFPRGTAAVSITPNYDDSTTDQIDCTYHGETTYAGATEFLRARGFGVREKQPTQYGYTVLTAKVDNIQMRLFPDEMPPTCRIEKVKKLVPKTQVTDLPGEFVEIEEHRVVCDGSAHA